MPIPRGCGAWTWGTSRWTVRPVAMSPHRVRRPLPRPPHSRRLPPQHRLLQTRNWLQTGRAVCSRASRWGLRQSASGASHLRCSLPRFRPRTLRPRFRWELCREGLWQVEGWGRLRPGRPSQQWSNRRVRGRWRVLRWRGWAQVGRGRLQTVSRVSHLRQEAGTTREAQTGCGRPTRVWCCRTR